MSHRLPPCDHDECPPTRCLRSNGPASYIAKLDRLISESGSAEDNIRKHGFEAGASIFTQIKSLLLELREDFIGMTRGGFSPQSAKFVPQGDQKTIHHKEGKVTICRGETDAGIECVAVFLNHVSGNEYKFLLTINGATALMLLLSDALSPNAERTNPGGDSRRG